MSNKDVYENLKQSLKSDEKDFLDDILREKRLDEERAIIEGINHDVDHLAAVNFCCNFFIPTFHISKETGYTIVLIEPLYKMGIKSFDLAIFRKDNGSLILIECKAAISQISKEVDEVAKAIKEVINNKSILEQTIGNKITLIEFVLCVPHLAAQEVCNEIYEKAAPIITWGFSKLEGTMQLIFKNDLESEMKQGRVHLDSNLRQLLLKGVKSEIGAIYTYPILPSSNRYTTLIYIIQCLFIMWRGLEQNRGKLGYVNIFGILSQALTNKTAMDDSEIHDLTDSLINLGKRKEVFEDQTPQINEVDKKIFRLTVNIRSAYMCEEQVRNKYVKKNALEKAYNESVLRFQEKRGLKTLQSFLS